MSPLEKNLRFFLGTYIGNSSLLFPYNYKREQNQKKIIRESSDLCVEGFQRSGNSFFVMLFRRKNKDVNLAHHMHSAIQVIKAVERKIPVIVMIRRPEDAVASLLTWDDKLTIGVALYAYRSFYNKLRDYRSQIIIAPFSEVTTDIGDIIRRVNQRYGTDFVPPDFTEEQLTKIRTHVASRQKNQLASPLPNEEKAQRNAIHKEKIMRHWSYRSTLAVHDDFLEKS